MSEYPQCPKRTRLVMFKADGSKDYAQRCIEQTAPTANKDVTVEDCVDCPIRRELVRNPREYRPATAKPASINKPKPDPGGDGFVPCGDRSIVTVSTCCGGTAVARICDNDLTQYFQGAVTPSICAGCKYRKP